MLLTPTHTHTHFNDENTEDDKARPTHITHSLTDTISLSSS